MFRVRNLHLTENNIQVDGQKVSAALCDMAILFSLVGKKLLEQGKTYNYEEPAYNIVIFFFFNETIAKYGQCVTIILFYFSVNWGRSGGKAEAEAEAEGVKLFLAGVDILT